MFRGDKRFEEIKEKVENAIDDILNGYQLNYELSGDITPLDSVHLEKLIDETAETLQNILQFEFETENGEDEEIEDLKTEMSALITAQGQLEERSDEWWDMEQKIEDVQAEIDFLNGEL